MNRRADPDSSVPENIGQPGCDPDEAGDSMRNSQSLRIRRARATGPLVRAFSAVRNMLVGSDKILQGLDLQSTRFLPAQIDFERNVVRFAQLRDDQLRSISFHEGRHTRRAPIYEAPLDDVCRIFGNPDRAIGNARYIFHTAFCGSTLIARLLDIPEHTFAYREPQLMTGMSLAKANTVGVGDWPLLLRTVHGLLSRGLAPHELTIVKTPNACVNLLSDLHAQGLLNPSGAALLVYSELAEFLISILKRPGRRKWVRRTLRDFKLADILNRNDDVDRLTDAQAAVLLWASHMAHHRAVVLERSAAEVRVLRFQSLLEDAASSLHAVSAHLAIPLTSQQIGDSVARKMTSHAKSGRSFSPQKHHKRTLTFQREYTAELAEGQSWFEKEFSSTGLLDWPPPSLHLV